MKVQNMLAERFSQDPLETYFYKHPLGAGIDKLPLYDFGYAKAFRKQKVFKPITSGKVRDENTNFESNRTSSMSEKYKQNYPCNLQEFQAAIRYLTTVSYQHNK